MVRGGGGGGGGEVFLPFTDKMENFLSKLWRIKQIFPGSVLFFHFLHPHKNVIFEISKDVRTGSQKLASLNQKLYYLEIFENWWVFCYISSIIGKKAIGG